MSERKEKNQIDPEADVGHHNLGFQSGDGDKITMEGLNKKESKNIKDDDATRLDNENEEGKQYIF